MKKRTSASKLLNKLDGPMTFGRFVLSLRTLYGYSQAALAKKLRIPRAMVCHIEKGRQIPSPSLALKIAKVGGFPPEMALEYCLNDSLRKEKIKLVVKVAS